MYRVDSKVIVWIVKIFAWIVDIMWIVKISRG